jgi:hypothetical protein
MWHDSCPSLAPPCIETRRTAGPRNLAYSSGRKEFPCVLSSVAGDSPARRIANNRALRRADGQVLGAGYLRRQSDPDPTDRVTYSADGRREALAWLAENFRWTRNLDALRGQRPKLNAVADLDRSGLLRSRARCGITLPR